MNCNSSGLETTRRSYTRVLVTIAGREDIFEEGQIEPEVTSDFTENEHGCSEVEKRVLIIEGTKFTCLIYREAVGDIPQR